MCCKENILNTYTKLFIYDSMGVSIKAYQKPESSSILLAPGALISLVAERMRVHAY